MMHVGCQEYKVVIAEAADYNAAFNYLASVAKLVDALDLGSSGNPVGVRVSPLAPFLRYS